MNPDVASGTYVEYGLDHNVKKPKFKIGDHVIMSQNIFAKSYTPNWSGEIFIIKKVKKYCIEGIYYQRLQQ